MSIHNVIEVPEAETHEATNRTRDRFGRSHVLSNEDGTSRLPRRLKAAVLTVFFGVLSQAGAFAKDTAAAPRRNTDTQVSSEGLDANSWINQNLNQPRDKYGIPVNESAAIGFNEDGDSNLNMKF